MAEYLDIPFESDPDALSQEAFDYLQALIPNWVPSEGNLDVMLVRAIARIAGEVQEIASAVPTTIFRYAGKNLYNLPPIDAISAQGATTWTLRDNAGYTIPDGTLVGVRLSGDVIIPFQTVGDVVVPAGATSTAAGGVIIAAVNPGTDGNGLSGSVELIDSIGFVNSITLTAPTTGGVDAESDEEYLNRAVLQLQLLAPRPIIPSDFAAMALDIPGVHRALALDGYDPNTGTFDNERMVAVSVVDEDGNAVATGTRNAVADLLESNREVNFVVNMMDPTYTVVDVTYQVKAEPGFADTSDLQSRITDALETFLSPATWGLPSSGDQIIWLNEDTVRWAEVAAVITSVAGVRYVEALSIGVNGGAQVTTDVTLAGAAPMPTPGTIAGTIDL